MRRMARRPPKEFEILDVTSEVIRDYNAPSPLLESDDDQTDNGMNRNDLSHDCN